MSTANQNSAPPFLIGCNGRGAQRSGLDKPVGLQEASIDEQFRMVKESGVFDYFDRIPLRGNLREYEQAMARHDLPVHTASWFYRLGQDEDRKSTRLNSSHVKISY